LRRTIGFLIIALVIAAAVFAPALATHDPAASGMDMLAQPSPEYWLGADDLGRDIYSRGLYGGRLPLVIGFRPALVAGPIRGAVGLIAGYSGGTVDLLAVQVIDLFIALPGLVLALIITAMVGPTVQNLVLVLGFVMWPTVARLVRGQVLALREMV